MLYNASVRCGQYAVDMIILCNSELPLVVSVVVNSRCVIVL